MKILLVGEYSRLHNSLKEGLVVLGHEVLLISSGDFFKNYPSDIKLNRKYERGVLKKLKIGIYKIFKIDIESLSLKKQFFKHRQKLKSFDVVQLINQNPIGLQIEHEIEIINFLKQHNKKLFLLACGTDYKSVKYAYEKKFRYSILTPYFEGKITKKAFNHILQKISREGKSLFKIASKSCNGIITSDLDYHIPYKGCPKYLGLVPNPINLEKLNYEPLEISNQICIFHGINTFNYYKKGNDIFEKALSIINSKYSDRIIIKTVRSLPYYKYITTYNEAHILLDQVYAYDQGFNALEAMAKGKVVFTGAEQEWLDYYNLKEDSVAINALPDAENIAKKLEWLILNPQKITEISINARHFVEMHHNHIKCAERYLNLWKNN